MAESDFYCPFREYRGDIGLWWCTWKIGACERISACDKPPILYGR